MSIKTLTTVWEHSQAQGTQLLLMLALADFADDSGEAFPKIATLARRCRVSERTIMRAIDELVEKGELAKVKVRMRRGGQRNHYQILCLPGMTICQAAVMQPDTGVTMQPDTCVTLQPDTCVTLQPDTCVTSINITTKNKTIKNTHHSFSSFPPAKGPKKIECVSVTDFAERFLDDALIGWTQEHCPAVVVTDATQGFLAYHQQQNTIWSSENHILTQWRGWMKNAQRFATRRNSNVNMAEYAAELTRAGIGID